MREERQHLACGPVGVSLAAAALTLLMAAPVLLNPTSRLFGTEIVGRHHDPFTVINHFERSEISPRFVQPATDYPGAALAALMGDGVAAYNALVLITFPLAALFTFLLARQLGGGPIAAWIAAFLYAFAPFHLAHAAYHPHVAQTQWLPLFLLALWRSLDRPGTGRLVLLAAAAGLLVLSNFYAGLLAAVVTPCALAVWWFLAPRSELRGRNLAITSSLLLGLAAAGAAWVAVRTPGVLQRQQSLAFPREDLLLYAAHWYSYLLPSVEHPLFGAWATAFWAERQIADAVLEQQLTLGWGSLVLAVTALALRPRSGLRDDRWVVPSLASLGLIGFLFSLPPDWRLGAWVVPGPSAALYVIAPMFRAHARFGLMVALAVALLAGLGAERMLRSGGARRWLAASLLLASAVELAPLPPWRWRPVLPTAAHRWLAAQPPDVRAFDCVPGTDPTHAALPRLLDRPLGLLGPYDDCAAPGFAGRLAAQGFDYLIARRHDPLGVWLTRHGAAGGLEPVERFEDSLVLAVVEAPTPVWLTVGPGFHWREFKDGRTYRWMTGDGQLWLENPGTEGGRVELQLTLHAFAHERRIAVELDGRPLGELTVGIEIATHSIGPFDLVGDRHVLRLLAERPATVADELLGNGDFRPLTVALWEGSVAIAD